MDNTRELLTETTLVATDSDAPRRAYAGIVRALLKRQPGQGWAPDCDFRAYSVSQLVFYLLSDADNAVVVYNADQQRIAVWTDRVGYKYLVQALPLSEGEPGSYKWAEQAIEAAMGVP